MEKLVKRDILMNFSCKKKKNMKIQMKCSIFHGFNS